MNNAGSNHIRIETKENMYTLQTPYTHNKRTNDKHTTNGNISLTKAKHLTQRHDGDDNIMDNMMDDMESLFTMHNTDEMMNNKSSNETGITLILSDVFHVKDNKETAMACYAKSSVTKDKNTLYNAPINNSNYHLLYILESNTHHTTTCSHVDIKSDAPDNIIMTNTVAPSELVVPYIINTTNDVNTITTPDWHSTSSIMILKGNKNTTCHDTRS